MAVEAAPAALVVAAVVAEAEAEEVRRPQLQNRQRRPPSQVRRRRRDRQFEGQLTETPPHWQVQTSVPVPRRHHSQSKASPRLGAQRVRMNRAQKKRPRCQVGNEALWAGSASQSSREAIDRAVQLTLSTAPCYLIREQYLSVTV